MTMYFYPPVGLISYQKMETYALNRLKFLLRLTACENDEQQAEVLCDAQAVQWSDCLIEGTVKDKISHYLLRLTMGNSLDMQHFLCNAEKEFFILRIKSFSEHEWKKFFSSLDRTLVQHQDHGNILGSLKCLVDILKSHFGSMQALAKEVASRDSSAATVLVPFQLLLPLVATRSVSLHQGMALFPVSMMVEVLAHHFHQILSAITKQGRSWMKTVFVDERIRRLSCVVKRAFMYEAYPSYGPTLKSQAISLTSLKTAVDYFPPCMSKPMKILHHCHRLHHHDRIQLTLFLKELGLPLHEALLFWRREYSQKPCGPVHGNCSHTWQGNERKYIYSIRHLYGLEGSRVQYRAHSCHSIQDRQLTSHEYGSCPFVSQDIESLTSVMESHQINVSSSYAERIDLLSKSKQFGKACGCLLFAKKDNLKDFLHCPETQDKLELCDPVGSMISNADSGGLSISQPDGLGDSLDTKSKIEKRVHMNHLTNNRDCHAKGGRLKSSALLASDNDLNEEDLVKCDTSRIPTFSSGEKGHLFFNDSCKEDFLSNFHKCDKHNKRRHCIDSHLSGIETHLSPSKDSDSESYIVNPSPRSKRRKIGEKEQNCPNNDFDVRDAVQQHETIVTKPTQFYLTYKSLVEGLKKCEMSIGNN